MRAAFSMALLLAALAIPLSAIATGLHECAETDRVLWLTKAELTSRLEVGRWSVGRIKEDGGCWKVTAAT